jgi:hypothetical protein
MIPEPVPTLCEILSDFNLVSVFDECVALLGSEMTFLLRFRIATWPANFMSGEVSNGPDWEIFWEKFGRK